MDSIQQANIGNPPFLEPGAIKAGKWRSGLRNNIRNHLIAMTAEFIGTFLFLFFAFSAAQVAVTSTNLKAISPETAGPDTTNILFISLGFGCALAVNVWLFFRVSGGMFNPAVRLPSPMMFSKSTDRNESR